MYRLDLIFCLSLIWKGRIEGVEKVSCYHDDNYGDYYGCNKHNFAVGDEDEDGDGEGEGEGADVSDHSKHVQDHGHCY